MVDYTRSALPSPTPETAPFWEAAKRHELLLPFCLDCRKFFFYPRSFCPDCHRIGIEWRTVSGKAHVYSYVVNYRPARGFEKSTPYIIALVELVEGPRMMTNLIGISPDSPQLQVGMAVKVSFQDVSESISLPLFTPDLARGDRGDRGDQ